NLPLPIKLEDLTNYPFISREKGSGSQAVIESAIAEVGLLLNPIVRLGSTAAILRSVEAELGFGIVSSIAAKTALENEKIKIIPVEGLKIARKLLMGFLPDRQLSIAAKSFVLLLEDPKNIFS
ncbi:MAG: LysR substrate-binding domain-containing protein, partial [SAR324 cluster bacterium]|nr:LysR substrate-binding domain-containing protein [SAR324 cluster bacterium]